MNLSGVLFMLDAHTGNYLDSRFWSTCAWGPLTWCSGMADAPAGRGGFRRRALGAAARGAMAVLGEAHRTAEGAVAGGYRGLCGAAVFELAVQHLQRCSCAVNVQRALCDAATGALFHCQLRPVPCMHAWVSLRGHRAAVGASWDNLRNRRV